MSGTGPLRLIQGGQYENRLCGSLSYCRLRVPLQLRQLLEGCGRDALGGFRILKVGSQRLQYLSRR